MHNENTTDLYFTMGRRLGRLLYEGRWFDPEALMLKEALTRWVAPAVTGKVSIELRRGDDYTILDTKAARSAYEPDKLSMERTASAFTPEDRIGALEMQSLGVLDNRELLLHLGRVLGVGSSSVGELLLLEGGEEIRQSPTGCGQSPCTSVPTPRSVKSSAITECGARPSKMCTLATPPSIARSMLLALATMPPYTVPSAIFLRSSVAEIWPISSPFSRIPATSVR